MKSFRKFFVPVLGLSMALIAGSCEKDNDNYSVQSEGQEIKLRSMLVRNGPETKAELTTAALKSSAYHLIVSAHYVGGADYFKGARFTWNDTDAVFKGVSPKFWPLSGSLNLLAYCDRAGNTVCGSPTYDSSDCSSGVSFTVGNSTTDQVDVCVAKGASMSSGSASLAFVHTLVKVSFEVKANTSSAAFNSGANTGLTITGLQFNGLKYNGTLSYSGNDCTWSALGTAQDHTFTGSPVNLTTTAQAFGSDYVLVPEQAGTATALITYTLHNGKDSGDNNIDNTGLTLSCPVNVDFSSAEGKHVIFTLGFSLNEITATPTVSDWTSTGTSAVSLP